MVNRARLRYKCSGGGRVDGRYIYLTTGDCKGVCEVDELRYIVNRALTKGIGAKTAIGYGKFSSKQ